jgi:starvation-inducible DNA-binding protein
MTEARTDRSTRGASDNGESPGTLSIEACREIAAELRPLLADVFTLYLKTKNFHWHMRAHFRDYHLLLDEQAEQLFGMTDDIRHCGAPAPQGQ